MAGIGTIDTAYGYERARRKALRTPASMSATPDIAAPTLAYAAATGREETRAQATASDAAYEAKRRAVDEQGFQSRLAYDRKVLDAWGKQNQWATAIALANLGIEGMSIPVRIREAERQEQSLAEIAAGLRKNAAALTEGTRKNVDETARVYEDTLAAAAEIPW